MNFYNIEIIVAHANDLVIGFENKLPWPHNKEDMKHFKKLTVDQICVMGRKTWSSILEMNGKPLEGRISKVLGNATKLPVGMSIDFKDVLEIAEKQKVMIIGGEQIYKLFFPYANTLHVTRVLGDFQGDTYFPEYRNGEFECIEESGKPGLRFLTYKRTQNLKLI